MKRLVRGEKDPPRDPRLSVWSDDTSTLAPSTSSQPRAAAPPTRGVTAPLGGEPVGVAKPLTGEPAGTGAYDRRGA